MIITFILIRIILSLYMHGVCCMLCDRDYLEFDEKCYSRNRNELDRNSAFLTCTRKNKGTLATVDTEDIDVFLQTNVSDGINIWIGIGFGKRVYTNNAGWQWDDKISKYEWTWSDGTTISHNAWNNSTIISACVVMAKSKEWYTQPCTFELHFVCEKEMTNDTCGTWMAHKTHCYLFVNHHNQNCMAAAQFCSGQGAYLLSINNQEEANFAYEVIKNDATTYWIGLSPFSWADDTPYRWNNWDDNGPNINDKCTFMDISTGKWSAGKCEGMPKNSFICQRATIDFKTTTSVNLNDGLTNTYSNETHTNTSYAQVDKTAATVPNNKAGLSQQVIITSIVPAVAGVVVIIIVILVVVVVVFRRRKRFSKPSIEDQVPTNTIDEYDKSLDVYDAIDPTLLTDNPSTKIPSTNAHGQETNIYDTAEIVQGPASTIVVNGDVYAIVDKDKPGNNKMKDNNNTIHDITKDRISKGQSHIVVGTDVYAIVDKEKIKLNKQKRPKQKKKKPAPPPKLEEELDEINSIGQNHIVVGSDVYAIVDKDKATPNNQKKPKQKKKKLAPPSKLEDKSDEINTNGQNHILDGSDVYAIVDIDKVTSNNQTKPKQKKKKQETPPKLEDRSDKITPNGENHIVVGSDIYAIVAKDTVTLNSQKKPKQKKKKQETLPKLEDRTDKITPNGENHIVVGSDVYAIVDKNKATPNNQKKPMQKKKKPETPPKVEDKEDKMDEGNVYYNEFNMNTVPLTPTKHNAKGKDKDEEMNGIVYADLDLTGPGPTDGACINEEAEVVYSDVRH